ncbi:zinc finger MYM-type protein 1-like [Gymnodraco acuticeps]|uniref:Zinc finger MYM-type protein 1-like n=1 Tax=Gymnodraco acuticeps TaxID=8218 RepID=A0A6P8WMW8_GYMAC|nr:zinc finger MYM-type protein 1-like [Gymnodraco acuticeps]
MPHASRQQEVSCAPSEASSDIAKVAQPASRAPTVTAAPTHPRDTLASDNSVTEYPTDRGKFPVDLEDDDVKRYILNNGPCKPEGPFKRDGKGRCFSKEFYNKTSKIGCRIPRKWLCYSPSMDRVYCEQCWLFGDRPSAHHLHQAWRIRINDWQGLSKKIKEHELSRSHLAACVVYDTWKNNLTIDAQISSEFKREVGFWTEVLTRITDVTLTLASRNSAFRGHREKICDIDNGNLLSTIELMARYDPVLQRLIESKKKVHYLSPQTQNEIISLLSKKVQDTIITDIQNAEFYSIIMDTTQDISKVDQLSQVFRYVTIANDENGNPTEVKINESFLGFHAVTDQTAAGLEREILESMERKGILFGKCRGQGYDGASNMSGVYSGVQKHIRDKEPNAVYIHCAAHNLNLVLNDACQNIPEIKDFYDTVERLYVFFSGSIKRWELLETHLSVPKAGQPTLKRLCPTRWASRQDAVQSLRFRYADIMQALTKIDLLSKKSEERAEATGLKKAMESFEFVVMTVIQGKVLETVNIVSQALQRKDVDLLQATVMLGNATDTLAQLRGEFDGLKAHAQDLASSWGVHSLFKDRRARRTKRHFSELCEDQRLQDHGEHFRVAVFYANFDIVVAQLKNRFVGMSEVA